MPLLENIIEGVARAGGSTGTVNAIEKNKSHRQALSDEALEDTVQSHMDTMKGLQAKIGQNPNDPELQKALSGERDQLFQLLHPANNPDHLGRVQKLFRHVFRQPEPGKSVNNLPSGASMTAAAPQDEFSGFSAQDRTKAQRIKAGLDPRATADKPDPENWQVVTGVSADGKPFTFQHNSKSGESQGLDGKPIPPEQLQGFTVPPKGSGPKVGTLGDFLTQAYGPHPTAQQALQGRSLWAQANAGTTVGEHVVMVPQVDGSIKPVTVVTTSTKTFPGAGKLPASGTPAVSSSGSMTVMGKPEGLKVPGNINLNGRPILHNSDGTISSERSFSIGTDQGEVLIPRVFDGKDHTEQEAIQHYRQTGQHMGIFDTPQHADAYAEQVHNRKLTKPAGTQKKELGAMTKKPGAGVASVGDAVGGKRTTAQNKADNDVVEATKLSSIADQVAQKPEDAINQKRLAVALERASAGRFTTQALDYIIKAGWGNTIEQWANNPGTGALPKDVMRQLVDGAHQNLVAAKKAKEAAFGEGGGGEKSGKKHSLKKAMELPFNKGKSEADVRKDLESHGYEVTP